MLENSLWLQLYSIFVSLQLIFIHLALMQQSPLKSFLDSPSSSLFLPRLLSLWRLPAPAPSLFFSSSSLIPLFFSSPSSVQSPTSSWTLLLVSCSWLIVPHGNIFSVDVKELLLLDLNNTPLQVGAKGKCEKISFFCSYPNIATFDEGFINLSMMHFSIW